MLLRDFVNKKIASADKEASAEGVPLTLNNCKKYKKMRDLKVYGNCFQDGTPTPENPIEVQCVGELVTDENDVNYGKYRAPIICRGKNYYDDKSVGYRIAECQSYEKLDNGFRAWGKNGGVTYSDYRNGQLKTSKLIELTAGQYTFSFDYYVHQPTPISTVEFRAGLLNKSESYWHEWMMVYPSNRVGAHGRVTKTITFSEDIEFFFAWRVNGFDISITNIQIEKSDSLTDFEPYVEPIRTELFLDEPLRRAGTYVDYIDGRNKKLHRLIYEYYLDGSQTVLKYSNELCFVEGKVRCKHVDYGLSSHFRHRNYGATVPNIAMVNAIGSRIQIGRYYDIDGVTDAETLKQWFTKNPTTFIQPLETPIVEDLDIELPKLNAKTTIIEVDTSLAPSNISGKYIIR